jgi:hypothetical protein
MLNVLFVHTAHLEQEPNTSNRLIILLTLLHGSWCCLHVGLETVVPLWMFSPPARGGLGFEPVDAALVFGFVGCVLLMLKSFVPARLSSLAQHAPLRALRVSLVHISYLYLRILYVCVCVCVYICMSCVLSFVLSIFLN